MASSFTRHGQIPKALLITILAVSAGVVGQPAIAPAGNDSANFQPRSDVHVGRLELALSRSQFDVVEQALSKHPRRTLPLRALENRWAQLAGRLDEHIERLALRRDAKDDEERQWLTLQRALLPGSPLRQRLTDGGEAASRFPTLAAVVRAHAFLDHGRTEEARVELTSVPPRERHDPDYLVAQARLALQDRPDATLDYLDQFQAQHRALSSREKGERLDPLVPALRGEALLAQGDIVAARSAAEEAHFVAPIHPATLALEWKIAERSRKWDEMLALTERSLELWGPGGATLEAKIEALVALDRAQEARTALATADSLPPLLSCKVAWACRDSELLRTGLKASRDGTPPGRIAYYDGLLAYLDQDTEALAAAVGKVEDAQERTHLDELTRVRRDADRRQSGRNRWGWYLGGVALAAVIAVLLYRSTRGRGK